MKKGKKSVAFRTAEMFLWRRVWSHSWCHWRALNCSWSVQSGSVPTSDCRETKVMFYRSKNKHFLKLLGLFYVPRSHHAAPTVSHPTSVREDPSLRAGTTVPLLPQSLLSDRTLHYDLTARAECLQRWVLWKEIVKMGFDTSKTPSKLLLSIQSHKWT